jgi:DNA-binding XRE family transcriptional regulator
MAYLGYDAADLSIGFGCNSLDAWAFSGLNASVEIVPPPYDISQQVPQESSLPSYAEVNSWFPESLLNLSSSEINNDILHDAASQNELEPQSIVKIEENNQIISETTQMLLCTEQLPPESNEMDTMSVKAEPVKIKSEVPSIKPEPIWHGHSNSNSMFSEMFKEPLFVKGESNPAIKHEQMDQCSTAVTFSLIEALKSSDPSLCDKWNQQPQDLLFPKMEISFPSGSDTKSVYSNDESSVDTKKGILKEEKISRKDFRLTVGREFYLDLISGSFCYDELIQLYQQKYPQYAKKFTRNFCTKLRTGRIMNEVTQLMKRKVKDGDEKMRRISVKSPKGKYQKMTEQLFWQIIEYERQHKGIKQADLEAAFNVNRTTLTRWKKNKLEATV